MFNLGLSKRQTESFFDALKHSHRIKIIVHVLNSDEDPVNDFDFHFGTTHILDGAVQVDTTADVKRSLSMTLLDPYRRFRWSPDHTSPGTLFSGDFIAVKYAVHVDTDNLGLGGGTVISPRTHLGEANPYRRRRKFWVICPVFHGPLTAYEASGNEITLEAQGKEVLGVDPHLMTEAITLDKHERIDDCIKEVMKKACGEQRFAIPDLPYRLPHKRTIHPRSEPWKIVVGGESAAGGEHVAGLINKTGKHPHEAFYDGAGRLKVRRLNKEPDFTFTESWLLTPPDVTYDDTSFVNHVHVTGARGSGKNDHPAKADAFLPRKNDLSAWALRRNGVPQKRTMNVTVDNLKTDKDCRERARHLLTAHSEIGLAASFDCLPLPLLEEHDTIRVHTDDFTFKFPVKQFTIPLTSDQPMTIGENARVHTIKRKKSSRRGRAGPGGPGASGGNTGRKGGQN